MSTSGDLTRDPPPTLAEICGTHVGNKFVFTPHDTKKYPEIGGIVTAVVMFQGEVYIEVSPRVIGPQRDPIRHILINEDSKEGSLVFGASLGDVVLRGRIQFLERPRKRQ